MKIKNKINQHVCVLMCVLIKWSVLSKYLYFLYKVVYNICSQQMFCVFKHQTLGKVVKFRQVISPKG